MGSFGTLLLVTSLTISQPPAGEFSYSFAGSRPVPSELSKIGPNADDVVRPDAAGLRITPPVSDKQTQGWGVATNFKLSGDFELTARYELKAAPVPTKGAGAGVALNVVLDQDRTKFAKVGRFGTVGGKQAYIVECWTKNNSPNDYYARHVPTTTLSGRLRLRREGTKLRFLVADTPDGEFQQLQEVEFGAEDLTIARFVTNPNASPTPLEAVLTDFTVRSGNLADGLPVLPPLEPKKTTLALILAGVLVALLALAGVVFFVVARRRKAAPAAEPQP